MRAELLALFQLSQQNSWVDADLIINKAFARLFSLVQGGSIAQKWDLTVLLKMLE